LAKLAEEKARKKAEEEIRRKFGDKFYIPGDEHKKPKTPPLSEDSSRSSTPTDEVPTPEEIPTPKDNNEDKDKTILSLQEQIVEQLKAKIKELETNNNKDNNSQRREEIRNEILNSNLDESQKQELLKMLEKQTQIGFEKQLSNPTNYLPYILVGFVIVFVVLWFSLLPYKKLFSTFSLLKLARY
jgi:hypothetical protein